MSKKAAKPPVPPPAAPPRRRSVLPFVGIVVVLAIVAAYQFSRRSSPPAESAAANASAGAGSPQVPPANGPLQLPAATGASHEEPAAAKFGPHTQDTYPPLPETGFPPPRPMETVQAVYKFAAEHPEVLSYIPCYCGCDRQGHKGNDDCFVASRNAKGDVKAWDSHGMT